MKKYLQLILLFFVSLITVSATYFASENLPKLHKKYTRANIFKAQYIPKNAKIIRVHVEIYDDTKTKYNDILEVEFNKKKIRLLTTNATGLRGKQYFQLKPGKYLLKWKVSKSKYKWPRHKVHKKIITIKDPTKYVHILITGDDVEVTTS